VKSKYIIFPDRLLLFTALALVTIVVTYRFPGIFASIWYVFLLVLYFLSKDEAFWLAFFLITVDGFMGFMGPFTVTLNVLPDLPAIELCQFYILVAFACLYSFPDCLGSDDWLFR
jgi:4-hydroxybenzoate polyprenyltransferase